MLYRYDKASYSWHLFSAFRIIDASRNMVGSQDAEVTIDGRMYILGTGMGSLSTYYTPAPPARY